MLHAAASASLASPKMQAYLENTLGLIATALALLYGEVISFTYDITKRSLKYLASKVICGLHSRAALQHALRMTLDGRCMLSPCMLILQNSNCLMKQTWLNNRARICVVSSAKATSGA